MDTKCLENYDCTILHTASLAGQKRRSGLVETLWPITMTIGVRFPVGEGRRKKCESV